MANDPRSEAVEDGRPSTSEVLATSLILDLLQGLATTIEELTTSRGRVRALLGADVQKLADELEAVRATAYQAGYRKGRTDESERFPDPYELHPDSPSWEELQRIRGLEPNPDYPSGWGPIPTEGGYLGGRWPGRKPS